MQAPTAKLFIKPSFAGRFTCGFPSRTSRGLRRNLVPFRERHQPENAPKNTFSADFGPVSGKMAGVQLLSSVQKDRGDREILAHFVSISHH
jgi:hypothetical protein